MQTFDMKNILLKLIVVTVLFPFQACTTADDLDVKEQNVLSEENINPEALVVAAYGVLDYRFNTGQLRDNQPFDHAPSNWCFSDIRSGEAYKGGGGTGDNPGGGMHQLETHNIFPSSENGYNLWRAIYFGLKRIDSALRTIVATSDDAYPEKNVRIGELKVLRAHLYFEAMKNFGSFVWYDENTPVSEINTIPNSFDTEFLWSKIEDDLNDAIERLPDTQTDLGRINKVIAHAFLAKAALFQQKWDEAVAHSDYVINSGQYHLVDNIEKLYSSPGYGNPENVFAVQYSINDGSSLGNLNFGDLLNSPDSPGDNPLHPYLNGDDFHKPSQYIVNSFKVGTDGLPLLDSFNGSNVTTMSMVDPRLDHAIGRVGITWKNWTAMPMQENWNRDVTTYGNFVQKKNMMYPNDSGSASNPQGFPWALGNLDYPIIKYSDVLLWKAEASIELGNVAVGIGLINEIRNRAKNSPYVKDFDNPSQDAANYLVNPYPTNLSQDTARKALRMERRLELGNEGHAFYDLVRWGIAVSSINSYIETEKNMRSYLQGANLDEHEQYLPIPQTEIDASSGVYQQRAGY